MEKWEHLMFKATGTELEQRLPQLGEQGWEMVSMVPFGYEWENLTHPYGPSGPTWVDKWQVQGYRVVFKRRKP
jgi:hypothetical protein